MDVQSLLETLAIVGTLIKVYVGINVDIAQLKVRIESLEKVLATHVTLSARRMRDDS